MSEASIQSVSLAMRSPVELVAHDVGRPVLDAVLVEERGEGDVHHRVVAEILVPTQPSGDGAASEKGRIVPEPGKTRRQNSKIASRPETRSR